MISLNQYQNVMKNVFEQISSRFVSIEEYALLYKMIKLIGDEPYDYNRKFKTYVSNHYFVTVTKKRACAKPIYDDYYEVIIKPPKNLTSI